LLGLAGLKKSLANSSGHGALARLGPFGARKIYPSASVYGSFFIP